jgi:hypothetical protein
LTLTKESFEKIYRAEEDVKTKERMLLVLNVVYHSMVAVHVARDLHRNRVWTCVWLKRYEKESLEGLKNKLITIDHHQSYQKKLFAAEYN